MKTKETHTHHHDEHNHHAHTPLKVKTPWTDWLPLIVVIGFILGLTILFTARLDSTLLSTALSLSMGFFFVFFSLFKLINLSGFAMGYHEYDIISKSWYGWGYVYPFIELLLGILYLVQVNNAVLHVATIVLSLIVVIGVGHKLAKKEQFQCACLGTVLKVPLTKVSLVEYAIMALMAVFMLFAPATNAMVSGKSHGHETFTKYQSLRGEEYDKAFLYEMLEHHQGAVEMARLVQQKSKHPELIEFAKRIDNSQSAEIASMKLWQDQWYSSPSTMDHSMHDAMHHMNNELQELEGDAFDKKFLELMIEHHQDAIDMAATGSKNAARNEVRMLTEQIVLVQSQEISQMHAWQHSWGFTE